MFGIGINSFSNVRIFGILFCNKIRIKSREKCVNFDHKVAVNIT